MSANTFIELNDTPSNYVGSANKFARVNSSADGIQFWFVSLTDLDDVQATGSYTPQGGQGLIYSSAAGKWRPGTLDVYSAGNGLNKTALTLNVTAGTGGGLESNGSGVFISDIANVAGNYGSDTQIPIISVNSKGQITGVSTLDANVQTAYALAANYVGTLVGTAGQITVTGTAGINANATLNLVATGVTAGVYGNTTHVPQLTVDTYGRIQNVDLIQISGGSGEGGTSLGFTNIVVPGQTTVAADQLEDTLTLSAGAGINITTIANADTIVFSANSAAIAASISVGSLLDVTTGGVQNGQALIWNSSNSQFQPGNISVEDSVQLNDFSVVTSSASGNGSLAYNSAGVFTFTPANIQAVTQTLSWNANNYQLSISNGNTVNLSVLAGNVGVESQTLSLSGNVITISGTDSNVDLTPVLANVSVDLTGYATETFVGNAIANITPSSSYGDSNVLSLLGNNEYATQSYVDTAVGNVSVDLTDYATENYVNSAIANVLNGAPEALDTLAEIANALNNSNATLSSVAFSGDFDDLINRPALSISANTYLTYDGANLDLSSVVGQQGIQGNAGVDGTSVTSGSITESGNLVLTLADTSTVDVGNVRGVDGVVVASANITGSNLLITLSNSAVIDAGNVKGEQGDVGPQGDGNAGISIANVDLGGNLIVTLNDNTVINAGNVRGEQGDQGNAGVDGADGANGVGITSVTLVGGNLVLDYSNTSTQDVGNIQGSKGDTGDVGLSVTNAIVSGSGNLIITLSDTSTLDAGNVNGVDGVDGVDGIQLSNISVTTDPASGNGSLAYNNTTGVFTFTPANISAGGLGDLVGPSSATDNAVTRFDSTTGKLVQNSLVTISDTGAITAPNNTGSMIPFYYENAQAFPAAANSHGALAHNHADGKMYYAHAGVWIELANSADIVAGGGSSSTFADLTEINTADLDVHDIGRQAATTLVVTAPSASAYRFDQYGTINNPTIYTKAGTTIGFDLSALGSHPFQIQTTGASAYSTGLIHIAPNGTVSTGASAQGKTSGTLYWKVPASISGTYEYQCTSHGVMNGNIEIEAAAGAGAGSGIALSDLSGGAGINYDSITGEIALANTAVSAGTYGSSTKSARLTVDAQGRITSVTEATISGGNGGGSGATIERFKLNYNSAGALISTANVSAGIGSITIDSSSGGECTITFANGTYFLPPGSIMFYGYDYTNNKYQIVPMETSMGFREVPAGGTSGSPTLFNGASQVVVKLRLREAETGASRGDFGTTTHAWIQFVMYD